MPRKHILAVGLEGFPADEDNKVISCTPFTTHISLIDADVIILTPNISSHDYGRFSKFGDEDTQYRGKKCLSDNGSGKLTDDVSFWKTEIRKALNADKTIFLLSEKPDEFYYATGEKTYSGTGRNRQVTRNVSLFNSYSIFPIIAEKLHVSAGSEIAYRSPNPVLKDIWESNKQYFHYQVTYDSDTFKHHPIFFQTKGKGVLGGILAFKNGGRIIVLPALELEHPNFFSEEANPNTEEQTWSKEAHAFTHRFAKSLIEIDNSLKDHGSLSPLPSWAASKDYEITEVTKLDEELSKIEQSILALETSKEKLLKERQDAELPKKLLFETGKPLEAAVRQSLTALGFKAEQFQDAESEFDVVFTSPEGAFLGEVEGKDTKAVDVSKISQLMRNLTEYLSKEDVTEPARGVLFGNGYRLQDPKSRMVEFTDKCIKVSHQSNIALVRTSDLFQIIQILASNPSEELKKAFREAIVQNKGGIVVFPGLSMPTKT